MASNRRGPAGPHIRVSVHTHIHLPLPAGWDSWSGETDFTSFFSWRLWGPVFCGRRALARAGGRAGLLGGAWSNPSLLVPVHGPSAGHIWALDVCWPHYRKAEFSSWFWVSSAHPGLRAPQRTSSWIPAGRPDQRERRCPSLGVHLHQVSGHTDGRGTEHGLPPDVLQAAIGAAWP